jgi:beta-N-acetylhexosaminidase
MLDIEGLALSPADRELLREPAVGGVILFTRNFESLAQITDLVSEIRALRSPPLLIAVDHEGGRVQRFRDGFTPIPPMRQIGREFDRDPEAGLDIARQAGWLIASELRATGIDLCFAPCVDLDWGISDIIGNRSFHRRPDAVSDLASAFARGLRSAGMAAVAKHFPGHGAVVADSHLKLPVDRREYGLILDDMRPYERMMNTGVVAGVMLAHIIYREIDNMPAGFSEYWIQRELRSRLGFGGAIFCDDLSMKATDGFGRACEVGAQRRLRHDSRLQRPRCGPYCGRCTARLFESAVAGSPGSIARYRPEVARDTAGERRLASRKCGIRQLDEDPRANPGCLKWKP